MRMRRSTVALAISLALAGPVHPQASNTTTGACSPIVSQNSGPVTIECSGISEDVQRQLTEVQLDPAAVMSKLDEIAKGVGDLKEKAFDAERGILTTYEFNGAKREQAGGQHILTVGGELTDDFQKMQEMTTSKQWPALAALCERHITGTPKWLAPYYFAGVAYTMMGNKAKALSRLEHVAKYAQSDPRLTEVSNKTGILLDRLKAQP
jgi:hypothetical protein